MNIFKHKGIRIKNIGFLFFLGIVILVYLFTTFGYALLIGIVGFCIGLLVKFGIRKKEEVDE